MSIASEKRDTVEQLVKKAKQNLYKTIEDHHIPIDIDTDFAIAKIFVDLQFDICKLIPDNERKAGRPSQGKHRTEVLVLTLVGIEMSDIMASLNISRDTYYRVIRYLKKHNRYEREAYIRYELYKAVFNSKFNSYRDEIIDYYVEHYGVSPESEDNSKLESAVREEDRKRTEKTLERINNI